MHSLILSATHFLAHSLGILFDLPPEQVVITLWPFLFLSVPRYLITQFLVLGRHLKAEPRSKAAFRQRLALERPLVSVLLPGYNERDTLESTVISLLEQSYRNLEIIVISDGSNDGMDRVGQRLAARGWIRFFNHRVRGGKVSAANLALQAARGDYIAICDADTTFDRDAIWHLVVEFYRPNVMAVAGNVRVRNVAANLITRCQALQYILSIGLGRRVSAYLGILFIVSGAFGAFRRSWLERIGGWDTGPGEDADLTIKTRIAGGQVAFAPLAVCMTDAPDTWWGFFRQQMRWNRSTVRFRLRKYAYLLQPWRRETSFLNFMAAVDVILFQVVFAVAFPCYLVWLFFTYPALFPYLICGVTLLYMATGLVTYFIALALSERPLQDLMLLPYLPLYGLFLGWYLRFVRLAAYLDEYFFRTSFTEPYVPSYVQSETRKHQPW